jgi:ribonucleotide reductase beta subunit family protein with ferritin-like domain
VPKEWADKYKVKFDVGWDAYREQVFAKQKKLGILLRTQTVAAESDVQDWGKLSADERRLYARMMEAPRRSDRCAQESRRTHRFAAY